MSTTQPQPATDLTPEELAASPVHCPGTRLRWTTANVDEGLPEGLDDPHQGRVPQPFRELS